MNSDFLKSNESELHYPIDKTFTLEIEYKITWTLKKEWVHVDADDTKTLELEVSKKFNYEQFNSYVTHESRREAEMIGFSAGTGAEYEGVTAKFENPFETSGEFERFVENNQSSEAIREIHEKYNESSVCKFAQ